MKKLEFIDMQKGIADIMSALPHQFHHPAVAAAALAQALALHCRLWGIPEPVAFDMLSESFNEIQVRKH